MLRFRELAHAVLDLVYPPVCCVCDRVGDDYVCQSCIQLVSPVPEPHCDVCGQPYVLGICPECTAQPPAFLRARAAALFDGVLRDAIHALKYEARPNLAAPLGKLLSAYVLAHPEPTEVDAVVPVPLHRQRERRRGFNQSALLAQHIADVLGVPLLERVLIRCANTPPQVGLDRAQRRTNVASAFQVPDTSQVAGLRLLLVDDVMTTGATCGAASEALLAAGARSTQVLTLARQP
ncbi:MAG: ComF family protein [Armatimonadota bacterium]